MRHRSWEDKGDAVDEPVTITESELRSLKRGAMLGLISIFLALVAVGVAGWTWYEGTKKSPGGDLVTATEQPAATPAAVAPTNAEPSSSSAEPAPVTAAPSATSSAPTPAANATRVHAASAVNASASGRTVRRAQAARSVGKAKYGQNAVASKSAKPKTESFDASTTAPSPVLPPSPVSAEPAKSAAKDSTSSH